MKKNKNDLFLLLKNLLRPPGDGILSFSAGKGAALDFQKQFYGNTDILGSWQKNLELFLQKKTCPEIIVLGLPLDTGAGIRRGAAHGPLALRKELLKSLEYTQRIKSKAILDLGDVAVNPHILYDEMLAPRHKSLIQKEMFPDLTATQRGKLPVSPLDILGFVLEKILIKNPNQKVFVLGGDHSLAWPVSENYIRRYKDQLALVQIDAHTDLLKTRFGIKYCFGTWSYHANELLKATVKVKNKKIGRLTQVGIRQSAKTKEYWEKETGVKQYWADSISENPKAAIESIVSHFKDLKIKYIYFTNDIDGTTEEEAPSTGTPAKKGLTSEFVLQLIQALGQNFQIVAADLNEVAPIIGSDQDSSRTVALGAKYILATLNQQLKG